MLLFFPAGLVHCRPVYDGQGSDVLKVACMVAMAASETIVTGMKAGMIAIFKS